MVPDCAPALSDGLATVIGTKLDLMLIRTSRLLHGQGPTSEDASGAADDAIGMIYQLLKCSREQRREM